MTEEQWLSSESPHDMMTWLQKYHYFSSTKHRLFCLACCWNSGDLIIGEDAEWCVKLNNSPADNPYNWAMAWSGNQKQPSEAKRAHIMRDIYGTPHNLHQPLWVVNYEVAIKMYPSMAPIISKHSQELVQKVWRKPIWLTDTVVEIAKSTINELVEPKCPQCKDKGGKYAGYVKDLFHPWVKCPECEGSGHLRGRILNQTNVSILCDAMEDYGCDDQQLINHLRSGEEHYYGCWVLDLLMGFK